MNKRSSGFTLVELLIVIVVIAILAAISVVAYNGIQNRANDTTVQSDINSMAKKIQLDQVDRGEYIKGGSSRGNSASFEGFRYPVSRTAYWDSGTNVFYCEGQRDGQPVFRFAARSKSGATYRYDSQAGMSNLGNRGVAQNVACEGMDSGYSWSYGYYSNPDYGWYRWTEG